MTSLTQMSPRTPTSRPSNQHPRSTPQQVPRNPTSRPHNQQPMSTPPQVPRNPTSRPRVNHRQHQQVLPEFFMPVKMTDREMSIFVGKNGDGIKGHLKKFGRIGVRGVKLNVVNGGIIIIARCHDDVMKVVGYLGITLSEMFPSEFYRHKFTEESLSDFIGDKGCNIRTIGEGMEFKPYVHASLKGVLIKARTWGLLENIKDIVKDRLK